MPPCIIIYLLISAEASKLWDYEPYGKDAIDSGYGSARRSSTACLRAQTGRLEAAADSRRAGGQQGSRQPVDEAGGKGGRGRSQAQATSWRVGALEQRATSETARASGSRSTGSRLPGRGVDLRASGRGDPQRVRSGLPPGARKPAGEGLGALLTEKPARRATQRGMRRRSRIERWKEERWPESKKGR